MFQYQGKNVSILEPPVEELVHAARVWYAGTGTLLLETRANGRMHPDSAVEVRGLQQVSTYAYGAMQYPVLTTCMVVSPYAYDAIWNDWH
eukprot:966066-Rhodomonas_salina.1